jgi:site-specific DNA-methyltransferase (adenine-specific)
MRIEHLAENVTLYLGDCREIVPTLPRPAAVVTDPPYGMKASVDSSRFSGGAASSKARRGKGRDYGSGIVGDDEPFDPLPWTRYERVVLWGLNHFPYGLQTGSALVWVKRNDAAFGSFLSDAEIAWKKGGCGVYCFRDLSTYGEALDRHHPTQKPVPLMEWCIQQVGAPDGGLILDPYMGSGTTGVAAVRMGHGFTGIEISETYFDTACRRIEAELRTPRLDLPEPPRPSVQTSLLDYPVEQHRPLFEAGS